VAKLQYDPVRRDLTVLRQAVFARLRRGWSEVENVDYDGERLRRGFDEVMEFTPSTNLNWQSRFVRDIHGILWQLVIEGIIHPGNPSLGFPYFTLTEYGRHVIENEAAHPHDMARFLDQIRTAQAIDPTVEAYLVESLHSFRQNRLVAAAILLGVAAERAFLMIAEALLEAIKDSTEKAELGNVLDRMPIKPKLDKIHTKLLNLDNRKKQLPDSSDFPEGAPIMVTAIYDLIRQQRNDLGHPRDTPPALDRQDLETHLNLFASFYRNVEKLRSYLNSHKASI
jgi:hypothetical protein